MYLSTASLVIWSSVNTAAATMAIRLVGPKLILALLFCLTPRSNASPLVSRGGIQLAVSKSAERGDPAEQLLAVGPGWYEPGLWPSRWSERSGDHRSSRRRDQHEGRGALRVCFGARAEAPRASPASQIASSKIGIHS